MDGDIGAFFTKYEPYGIVPADWQDTLRQARRSCPVARSGRLGGFWVVTRRDDVETVLRTPRVFSSADGATIPLNPSAPVMPPLSLDPPLHTEFRRLLNPHLSAAAVAPHAPYIAHMARELTDRFASAGHCDFVADFARPLPAMVLGRCVLGITDLDALLELQSRVTVIFSRNSSADADRARSALQEYARARLCEEAAKSPSGGLVSALLHGTVADGPGGDRPLTPAERLGTLVILTLGGLGTTTDALSWFMVRLTDDPSLAARLSRPGWAYRELDELLRLYCPIQWFGRTVTQPFELNGVRLSPGDRVMVHLGSANRDDDAFTDPGTLDFGRRDSRPLGFGIGPHRCVGMHLARLVLQIAFGELLSRLADFDRDRTVPLTVRDGMSWPLEKLPVTFRKR